MHELSFLTTAFLFELFLTNKVIQKTLGNIWYDEIVEKVFYKS